MSERMTSGNQKPVSLSEELRIEAAVVPDFHPTAADRVRKLLQNAANRIAKIEEENEGLKAAMLRLLRENGILDTANKGFEKDTGTTMSDDYCLYPWACGPGTDCSACHQAYTNQLRSKVAELEAELSAIRRGEFVCQKCGLRKDSEFERGDF